MNLITIKNIFKNMEESNDRKFTLKGWVLSKRGNEKISFVVLNDGSTFQNLQLVFKSTNVEMEMNDVKLASSLQVMGVFKHTPDQKQSGELIVESFEVLKTTDDSYPLQKNGIAFETLRNIPHIRHRTNTFRAVMRIRSTLAQEVHAYFAKNDFLYHNTPIITSVDGEGAGEMFDVSLKNNDFFGKTASLGVTGQLHAEAYALGFGGVYTFGPTFRAENSHTQRHASEFWMIEPEVAFSDLNSIIELSDDLLKTVIKNTLLKHPLEFEFLNTKISTGLIERLNKYVSTKLHKISYSDAIDELLKSGVAFENKVAWGEDLATEHEKYLAETIIGGPVSITNYPKDIKAFYMRQNDDGKTVAAFDLLVPGIGELVGGSQREERFEKILIRANEIGIDVKSVDWYLELRKHGYASSAGFGIGFERLVMYVTGMENIRDVIAFPRTPNNLMM